MEASDDESDEMSSVPSLRGPKYLDKASRYPNSLNASSISSCMFIFGQVYTNSGGLHVLCGICYVGMWL